MKKQVLLAAFLHCATMVADNSSQVETKNIAIQPGQIKAEYSLSFPDGWSECAKPSVKEILWCTVNHNYSVWSEYPTIRSWKDSSVKDAQFPLVCNVSRVKKQPGLGANLYNETASFLSTSCSEYKLLKKGTLPIANVKAKWQVAYICQSVAQVQVYFLAFAKGNCFYEICFWGDASQIESRFEELQNIASSFVLLNT